MDSKPTANMADRLFISEVFTSIQGEGTLTGVPSVFIRTSGCNLRCGFCDTPYTSWESRGTHRTVAELVELVTAATPVRHVVFTGGEPLIAKGAASLCGELRARGYHITIETAGTVFRDDVVADLWSVSPKLAASTPDDPEWGPRHEAARIDLPTLRRFVDTGDYQLKFVVAEPDELEEIEELVAAIGGAREQVLLMPEGTKTERLDAVASWLGPICIERGFRFCDRLHVRLYGNTPGT